MKIKTQFIICIVVFTIILVIIGASVATSTQRVANLKAQENVANNIQRGAGNLSSISIEYFLYQQDTSLVQWQANFSSLSSAFSSITLNNDQQQQFATNISRDLRSLNATFGEVVSYLQTTPRTVSVRELQPFQDRWGNMTEQNQALNLDASQLSISFDTEAHQANDTNTILIVSLVAAFGALLATIYLLVFRRTLSSVAELQNGINTVSSGNLDYVIETKRQDEVSELSYAFNQMTANRKIAEEKLLAASLYARSLLEASLDPLVTISKDGKITDVNKSTEDVTGCSREELIGSDFSDYFTEPEQARAGYQKVFTEGLVTDYPLAIRSKSGKITDVLYNARVYLNTQGEIQGVFAAARDITERKKAEEALRQSEVKLRTVADFAYDLEYWVAPDGKMLYMSPSSVKFTGYTPDEFIDDSKLFSKIIHPDDKTLVGSHFESITEEERHEVDFRIITRDGEERWISHACQPVFDGTGKWLGRRSSNRDITERKSMEYEIVQASEKLKQSNAELEQFAYVASHDLQEPLRMVASYVQLIERRYKGKLDSDADEFIGYAVDGANRMRGLIDDLLTYSRVARLGKPFEPTDIESTLEIALLNLKTSIAENKAMVTHDKLPMVMADGGQLVQLFQNLIGNGIKFHGDQAPHVHVSAQVRDTDYLFSVRDNGIGISPEYYDRLFKIFQRLHTREEYPGSGIGLAVCKRIVERHGGRIWIESQMGKGSTIYFTLSKRNRSDSEK